MLNDTIAPQEADAAATRWAQIAQALRDDITLGRLAPGERLPNESTLAARFGVHRHTLRQAMQQLAREGFVTVRQGAGTFVRELVLDYALQRRTRMTENLAASGERGTRQLLWHDTVRAGEWAAALHLPARGSVQRMATRALVRGRPVSLTVAAFPLPALHGIAQAFEVHHSVTAALRTLGVADYTRQRSVVSARRPTAEEADALARPINEPVLVVQYVNVDPRGRPVEAGRTLFAADAVQLVVEPGD